MFFSFFPPQSVQLLLQTISGAKQKHPFSGETEPLGCEKGLGCTAEIRRWKPGKGRRGRLVPAASLAVSGDAEPGGMGVC